MSATVRRPRLAYALHGSGVPVVLLHGLTFDRTTWRPVIERLGDGVQSIAIDLPGHGESGQDACPIDEVVERVHALLVELEVSDPIVVGHSMAGSIVAMYAAAHPVRGVVLVDQTPYIRDFCALVRRLEPALRGPHFEAAFAPFQQSMGLDLVPEPLRSRVLKSQDARQELVLAYWEEPLRSTPDQMQARVEAAMQGMDAPLLGVFGRQLAPEERRLLLAYFPQAELEEWPERGHFVHLAEVDRFTDRLRSFIARCAS